MPSFPSTQYVQKVSEYRKACPIQLSRLLSRQENHQPLHMMTVAMMKTTSGRHSHWFATYTCVRARTNREYKAEVQMQKFKQWHCRRRYRGQWRIATEKNDMLWYVIIKARINNIHKAKLEELKTRNWHRNRWPEHRNPKPTRIRLPRELCGSRLLTRNRKQNGPKIFATYQCPSWGLARFDISPALFLFMKVT